MPIEIRELVIKATISDSQRQGNSSPAAAPSPSSNLTEQQKAALIEATLALIQRKKER